jgi:hypothetical protein
MKKDLSQKSKKTLALRPQNSALFRAVQEKKAGHKIAFFIFLPPSF